MLWSWKGNSLNSGIPDIISCLCLKSAFKMGIPLLIGVGMFLSSPFYFGRHDMHGTRVMASHDGVELKLTWHLFIIHPLPVFCILTIGACF